MKNVWIVHLENETIVCFTRFRAKKLIIKNLMERCPNNFKHALSKCHAIMDGGITYMGISAVPTPAI